MITVNLEEPPRAQAVRSYVAQQGFTFPIVLTKTEGKNYGIDKAYLVQATPTAYLIDSGGVIVDTHYGPQDTKGLEASLDKLPRE